MASSRPSLRRTIFVSLFAALTLFAASVVAQDANNNDNTPTDANPSTPSPTPSPTPTPTDDGPDATNNGISITNAPTLVDNKDEDPAIVGAATLSRAPTVKDYGPPQVPPTLDAPFMNRSTLPTGTVFICVGAILGAMGLAVLIWRAVIACLLHRSVARAAAAQHFSNDKAAAVFAVPPPPFYQQGSDRNDSSPGPTARGGTRRTTRGATPSATPSMTNLFFSPTSGQSGGGGGAGGSVSTRESRFLPSGFYPTPAAAGSATNLRPDSPHRYGNSSRHTLNLTPPESPRMPAMRDSAASSPGQTPGQTPGGGGGGVRAPSAYLEDLLDDNPQAFPPPQMPAQRSSHSRNTSYGSNRL